MSNKIEGLNIEKWKKSTSVGMQWNLVDFPKQQVSFQSLDGKKDPNMQFLKMTVKDTNGNKVTIALKFTKELIDNGILVDSKKGVEYTGKELQVLGGKFIFA